LAKFTTLHDARKRAVAQYAMAMQFNYFYRSQLE